VQMVTHQGMRLDLAVRADPVQGRLLTGAFS
jgi:hypothetical protein